MEREVAAVEVGVVAFDGEHVLACPDQLLFAGEWEEFELPIGLVRVEPFGGCAAAEVDADTQDFLAIEVGDEGIVVADGEADVGGVGPLGDVDLTADVGNLVAISHPLEARLVVAVAVAESRLPALPGRYIEVRLGPVAVRVLAGEVAPSGVEIEEACEPFGEFLAGVAPALGDLSILPWRLPWVFERITFQRGDVGFDDCEGVADCSLGVDHGAMQGVAGDVDEGRTVLDDDLPHDRRGSLAADAGPPVAGDDVDRAVVRVEAGGLAVGSVAIGIAVAVVDDDALGDSRGRVGAVDEHRAFVDV